jgi:hypothetical protein
MPEYIKANTSLRGEVDYTRRASVEFMLNDSNDDNDVHRMKPEDLASLRIFPGNEQCIDCDKADPVWASIHLGVFMCLECSGQHR